MTNEPLDVLIVESHPGIGSGAATDLAEAGHRLHHCHDTSDHGFGCRGLHTPSTCPLETHVDVAFVVRGGSSPQPSSLEDGVRCAIRAQVPIVEQGPEAVDPFAPWVVERVEPGADVVAACHRAVGTAEAPLEARIRDTTARVLGSSDIDGATVQVGFRNSSRGLRITLQLPREVSPGVKQALSVRVLDAIRSAGKTYGRVDVSVVSTAPAEQ